jgi:serine/threonine protein kinase
MAAQQPQCPPQIVHPLNEQQPVLEFCLTNQEVLVEYPNDPDRKYDTINLVKAFNPQQAYMINPYIQKISLEHHGEGWGYICFGIVLPRLEEGVYQMRNQCERVAIKCLNKRVVEAELRNGSREDPYIEILRMQTIGHDNVHVLGCIEALQDETYLYIIMPFCEQGSLYSKIFGREELSSEDQASIEFRQILENLGYLRDNHICHRDLSLDNCMIYQGRVVFSDLARSFRLPPNASYVHGTNPHGKPAYQPPEVFLGEPYNAYDCDLWAAVIILFNLLTGMNMYHWPFADRDLFFKYFILAGGLSMNPVNRETLNLWGNLNLTQHHELTPIIGRHSAMSQDVKKIFDGVLRMDPQQRWNLDDVSASPFVN